MPRLFTTSEDCLLSKTRDRLIDQHANVLKSQPSRANEKWSRAKVEVFDKLLHAHWAALRALEKTEEALYENEDFKDSLRNFYDFMDDVATGDGKDDMDRVMKFFGHSMSNDLEQDIKTRLADRRKHNDWVAEEQKKQREGCIAGVVRCMKQKNIDGAHGCLHHFYGSYHP